MENALIADRLDAFASLLELADANPYTARAYRRAAETIRHAPLPVADLVRAGRVRELRARQVRGAVRAAFLDAAFCSGSTKPNLTRCQGG